MGGDQGLDLVHRVLLFADTLVSRQQQARRKSEKTLKKLGNTISLSDHVMMIDNAENLLYISN